MRAVEVGTLIECFNNEIVWDFWDPKGAFKALCECSDRVACARLGSEITTKESVEQRIRLTAAMSWTTREVSDARESFPWSLKPKKWAM
jgi:ligand-binding SRPBCC domain-containing protein